MVTSGLLGSFEGFLARCCPTSRSKGFVQSWQKGATETQSAGHICPKVGWSPVWMKLEVVKLCCKKWNKPIQIQIWARVFLFREKGLIVICLSPPPPPPPPSFWLMWNMQLFIMRNQNSQKKKKCQGCKTFPWVEFDLCTCFLAEQTLAAAGPAALLLELHTWAPDLQNR